MKSKIYQLWIPHCHPSDERRELEVMSVFKQLQDLSVLRYIKEVNYEARDELSYAVLRFQKHIHQNEDDMDNYARFNQFFLHREKKDNEMKRVETILNNDISC